MQVNNLIKIMEEQTDLLNELIMNLKTIQKFIVESNLENFQEQLEREEKILRHIKYKDEERVKEIQMLLNTAHSACPLEDAMDFISDTIKNQDYEQYENLLESRKLLTESVGQVMYINTQNSILINSSRQFLRDLMKNLLGSKKENFLDKKV
jgi:flagellar biosynthesis/type III secretory pathway chaperone